MAARQAARVGARVILCEEDFAFGGRMLADAPEVGGKSGAAFTAQTIAELAASPKVTLMARTSVAGVYDGNTYAALQRVSDHMAMPPPHHPRQRFWKIVAKRAVLAGGAIERGIVFGGNDLPGVMMAGALRSYVHRFAAVPMRRMVLFTCNDSGWGALDAAKLAGIGIAAVVDTREGPHTALMAKARTMGAEVFAGGQVLDALGGHGVEAVDIRTLNGRHVRVAADGVAMSGGWNLNIGLASHLGHRPVWQAEIAAFVTAGLPPGLTVAGAASGQLGLAGCLASGIRAGGEAARAAGHETREAEAPKLRCGVHGAIGLLASQRRARKGICRFSA